MAERLLWNESQFQAPKVNVRASSSGKTAPAGFTIYDACGVNALAMAESALSGAYVNTMDVFARMAPAGLCDETGRTVIENIQRQAVDAGFVSRPADLIHFTSGGIAEATWRAFLSDHTSRGAVVIVETNHGQVLTDLITQNGEDATNLARHFFGVYQANTAPTLARFPGVSALPHGYVCADGCNNLMNPVKSGIRTRVLAGHQMVYYPYSVVRASQPVALVAIYPKPAPAAPAAAAAPTTTTTTTTTTAASATTITVTLSPAELQALESLLARLPHS